MALSKSVKDFVESESKRQGVSPDLVFRVISAESSSNAGTPDSSKGAIGLMQLMPGTAKEMGVTNPRDTFQNIRGGIKYLKTMLDRYNGDQQLAIAAYNAGPGNVDKYGGVPPFSETQSYVKKIVGVDGQESSLNRAYKLYKAGKMNRQDAAQYEYDVLNGHVILGPGQSLNRKPSAYVVPQSVVGAYNSHRMSDDDRIQFEQDLRDGIVSLPRGTKLQKPKPRTSSELFGMGARDVAAGVANVADIAAGPVGGVLNLPIMAVGGEPVFTATPTRDVVDASFDAIGVARPESKTERMISAINQGGASGIVTSGAGAAVAAPATAIRTPSVVNAVGREIAANPVMDVVSGMTSGAAGEAANDAGAGPVGTTIAAIGGGIAPFAAKGVGSKIVPRLGGKAGRAATDVVDTVPASLLIDEAGELTDEAHAIATRNGISPEEMKAAVTESSPEYAAKTNRPADIAPVVEPSATEPSILERKPFVQASETITPETPLPRAAQIRLAEAESEGIPLSRGQATQDFATQDAEMTMRVSNSLEGEKVRAFVQHQSEKIKEAVDRLQASYGNPDLEKAERGQIIKNAIEELRDNGAKGVSELYEQFRALGGEGIDVLPDDILRSAQEVFDDQLVPDPVKNELGRQMARFGLIGKIISEASEAGTKTVVQLDNGAKVSFYGKPQKLTAGSAEEFAQAINRLYKSDPTHATQAVKRAVDDAVERSLTEASGVSEAQALTDARAAARGAYQKQKQTFAAKDVIQRIIDKKNGTNTDAVLPENAIREIIGSGPDAVSNLKKIKAVLLAKPTEKSVAAWNAIKAQGIADIFKKAWTTNANLGGGTVGSFSGAKLSSAIDAFGKDKLMVLLDPDELSQLKKIRSIIGNATIPVSGTTNPSGTAAKLVKFITPFINGIPGVGQSIQVVKHLKDSLKEVAHTEKTLRGVTSYTAEEAAKEAISKPKADALRDKLAKQYIDLITEFIDVAPKAVTPAVSGINPRDEKQ